jgi:polysaccharide export outer membrane protein
MDARRGVSALLGLALGLVLAGCATRALPLPPPPDPDPMDRDAYVIGPADVLSIRVWKNPELSVDRVPVRPDGRITFPLLDDVQAGGLAPLELKQVLTRGLSSYITIAEPDVTVVVVEVNSKRVFVVGEVARPKTLPLSQDLRVLDAITLSGGFNPYANKRSVKVLRRTKDGDVIEYRFDFDAFVAGDAPGSNLVLHPGDTIVVPD